MSSREQSPSNASFSTPVRHILSLSGGKDSTALALHVKDRVPDMKYVFCDTGEELLVLVREFAEFVFCVNVLHGEKLASRFRPARVSVESVSAGENSDPRKH